MSARNSFEYHFFEYVLWVLTHGNKTQGLVCKIPNSNTMTPWLEIQRNLRSQVSFSVERLRTALLNEWFCLVLFFLLLLCCIHWHWTLSTICWTIHSSFLAFCYLTCLSCIHFTLDTFVLPTSHCEGSYVVLIGVTRTCNAHVLSRKAHGPLP